MNKRIRKKIDKRFGHKKFLTRKQANAIEKIIYCKARMLAMAREVDRMFMTTGRWSCKP